MQRPRHRKSRAASGAEVIARAQKQKGVSRLFEDSWSYDDGTSCHDMIGQSTLEPACNLPVRKLRAEELSSIEVESKRRLPNVIARLMGLEALPSPTHVQTRQERFIGNHQHDCRSTRMSSSKHLESKDVYEDLEAAAQITNRSYSSEEHAQSVLIEPESDHVGYKLKEMKSLFADENFQYAEEHIHAPEVYQSSPPGSYIALLKPEKYEGKVKPWRLAGDTSSCRHSIMSNMKRQDGLLLEQHNRHRVRVSQKSRRAPLEDTDEGNILSIPTRIVVLKPNLGKMKNDSASKSVGSHFCPHSKRETYHKVASSMPTSKESREIAREIARKMRNGFNVTKGFKSTRFIGYAGDESSYDPDETDSESESEVITLSSIKSFDDNNLPRYSTSTLVGSSPNKEANTRLPEKLKTAPKYQDLEIFTKGTTLGEMFSLPDVDARPNHLHAKRLGQTALSPLGISSRDGWPNKDVKLSSRLRLHPHFINGSSSNRKTDRYEFCEERDPMHDNSSPCSVSKLVKEKSSHQETFTPKISRYRGKKSLSCSHTLIEETGSSSDASFKIQMTSNTKDISEDPHTCENHVTDERSGELRSPTSDLLPKQLHLDVYGEGSAVQIQEDPASQKEKSNHQASPPSQHLGAEPESSSISKDEADHHSPISVLKVPFVEDSPESFERVSAELHELRMQLQLLKMESGTFTDSSTLDEGDQTSLNASEENHVQESASENWDLLINSGLEESEFDMFRTTLYSDDGPLNPKLLFEELKKNYSNEMGSSRSERRLLCHMIHSHISEIFQNHADLYPWVMPIKSRSCLKLQNEATRDAFEKLINQKVLNREILSDIDREMQWSDMKGEINAIGNEVANLLVDDLITDMIS